jgi:hypothetical protein
VNYSVAFKEVWGMFVKIQIEIVDLSKQNKHMDLGFRPANITLKSVLDYGV